MLVTALGLTGRLAAWIPPPVVLGLLASAIMPFVVGIFKFSGKAPALVGGHGGSLPLPGTSLATSPKAGERPIRHHGVYIVATAAVVTGVLAGMAAEIPKIILRPLLLVRASLSLVDILLSALQKITQGPLSLRPLSPFSIALSGISFLSFGNYFWALVSGEESHNVKLQSNQVKGLASPTIWLLYWFRSGENAYSTSELRQI